MNADQPASTNITSFRVFVPPWPPWPFPALQLSCGSNAVVRAKALKARGTCSELMYTSRDARSQQRREAPKSIEPQAVAPRFGGFYREGTQRMVGLL